MRGEKALQLWLAGILDAANLGDVLHGLKLHDNSAREFDNKFPDGLVIGNGVFTFSDDDHVAVDGWDDAFFVTVYARVRARDQSDRVPALDRADAIAKAIFRALVNDRSIGGRACDVMVGRAERSFSNPSYNEKYAYVHIPFVVNPRRGNLPAPFDEIF